MDNPNLGSVNLYFVFWGIGIPTLDSCQEFGLGLVNKAKQACIYFRFRANQQTDAQNDEEYWNPYVNAACIPAQC